MVHANFVQAIIISFFRIIILVNYNWGAKLWNSWLLEYSARKVYTFEEKVLVFSNSIKLYIFSKSFTLLLFSTFFSTIIKNKIVEPNCLQKCGHFIKLDDTLHLIAKSWRTQRKTLFFFLSMYFVLKNFVLLILPSVILQ